MEAQAKIEVGSEWVNRSGRIVRVAKVTEQNGEFRRRIEFCLIDNQNAGASAPDDLFRAMYVPVTKERPSSPAPTAPESAEDRRLADVTAMRATIERLAEENTRLRAEKETLRDRFAMAALNALIPMPTDEGDWSFSDDAKKAYEMADAMIAARSPGAGKEATP